ncbi:hypothetical protein L6164_029965, partial [Bauhinia variegata]
MDLNFDTYNGFISSCQIDGQNIITDPNELGNLENEWEFEENLESITIDPFYEAHVDPVSFAPQTWVNSNVDGIIPYWSVSPAEVSLDVPSIPTVSAADSSLENNDFPETVNFMSQILMEENLDQKQPIIFYPLSLQVTEKSFYDALKENHTSFPNDFPLDMYQKVESPDVDGSGSNNSSSNPVDVSCQGNPYDAKVSSSDTPTSYDHAFQLSSGIISQNPSQPPNALTNTGDETMGVGSSINETLAQNIFSNAESVLQFKRGLEEGSKFLPKGTQLTTGLENNSLARELNGKATKKVFSMEKDVRESSHRLNGRKNHDREGIEPEEGRSNKQLAAYVDESELTEMFDRVLLSIGNVPLCDEHGGLQNGSVKMAQPNSSDGGKTRSKKRGNKKETVDFRTLLILCAQAVSGNDNRTANELLKQIRQHSSPIGDASQRLAHYFANGLEARLVGARTTGTQTLLISLFSKRISTADFLKANQVIFNACPFKFAHFFSYKIILKAAEKSKSLHIVDFGISYGFQWPMLIKFLSERSNGPPKLRITGIEFPQSGFRPTERIEETGRLLANYCKRFNVPFEFKAIASQKWETIQIEEFNIDSNELLVVNELMRFKTFLDDTVEVNNPKNAVLKLIKMINPNIYVQTIINGAFNSPFFLTRFREALFHFSAIYDMFDTLIPREDKWRLMIEREFLGRDALNVIACEGLQRVVRPETYKQWQVRIARIGFRQLPLDKELMDKFRGKLKACIIWCYWEHGGLIVENIFWYQVHLTGWMLMISCCTLTRLSLCLRQVAPVNHYSDFGFLNLCFANEGFWHNVRVASRLGSLENSRSFIDHLAGNGLLLFFVDKLSFTKDLYV